MTGHVQGVFFRASTRAEAERRGVAGWVRNRPDGTVEAELEGPDEAVRAVADWMEHGPDGAHVVDVEVGDLPGLGEVGFRVR